MIDIIGAISLTAVFTLSSTILVTAGSIEVPSARRNALVFALAWFVGIAMLGVEEVFETPGFGTLAIGLAVLLPVVLLLGAATRSAAVQRVALTTPLNVLVVIHVGRVLGVFFLLLMNAGRLPPTFAMAAGWGDVVVGAAALPLAWAIQRQIGGWRLLTLGWNVLGFVDLVTAVTLGVGSAPDFPFRFISESPGSGAVATLPWLLIPGVLVPLYLLTHLAIFAQLARQTVGKWQMRESAGFAWNTTVR